MASGEAEFVVERLARVLPVRSRGMFGGVGLYSGEHFFGLIANDVLYLKVDDETRADYEARGMPPFQPFADKPPMRGYHELPADVLADDRRLREWTRKAVDVARAAARSRSRKSPRRKAEKLANIGPVSRAWLLEVGVETRADLARRGSVAVFLAVKKKGLSASVNLLYALEGALLGLRWDRLPEAVKRNLRERAGLR